MRGSAAGWIAVLTLIFALVAVAVKLISVGSEAGMYVLAGVAVPLLLGVLVGSRVGRRPAEQLPYWLGESERRRG